MEYTNLLLSVVVVAAVIAFGALISVGNERQRQAIMALHRAYSQKAKQELRIMRGTVSAQTQIHDITAWLTKAFSLAFERNTIVMDFQVHESPVRTVEFHDPEVGKTVVCTLESPDVLMPILKRKRPVIRGQLQSNPILRVGKKTSVVEMSMLNAGSMFDIELPIAWQRLTQQVTEADTLWAYVLD